jgi:hypothetical protein
MPQTAKYGIDIQIVRPEMMKFKMFRGQVNMDFYFVGASIVSFYVSTATFFLLHCDKWDRVVALSRHKFVTGATLLQLSLSHPGPE